MFLKHQIKSAYEVFGNIFIYIQVKLANSTVIFINSYLIILCFIYLYKFFKTFLNKNEYFK